MQIIVMALKQESQGLIETLNFPVLYTGVGLTKASALLSAELLKSKPTCVINFGTAGSKKHSVGSLVECTKFVQRYPLDKNHYWAPKQPAIEITPVSELPKAICGSADFIETHLQNTEYDVMDMEAYALAFVCRLHQIPFFSFKYITDASDQNTVQDWTLHHSQAARMFLDEIKKIKPLFHGR